MSTLRLPHRRFKSRYSIVKDFDDRAPTEKERKRKRESERERESEVPQRVSTYGQEYAVCHKDKSEGGFFSLGIEHNPY